MEENKVTEEKKVLEENLKEILNKIGKQKQLSEQQLEQLKATIENNLDIVSEINSITLACPDKRVIFVDGNIILLYEDGEFFIEDTIYSTKLRKKLTRKKAIEMYMEYFIRYVLNPAIEKKKTMNLTKTIVKQAPSKEKQISKTKKIEKIQVREDVPKEKKKEVIER